jgi:hypothetical protein
LTAVEDGPQDFIRARWKMAESEQRGWSLSRPKSGVTVENTFLINVSGFGKFIRNREKWGYPQPWMQIRLKPNRIEFFRPTSSTLHALDFQGPIDLLFPIVKDEILFLIGKRNLLEINLEHAMVKSFE